MKTEYDVIVIGGGAGGLSFASGAAQLGVKTLIIDKNPLGGDCLWHGCVPSKTLIKSAYVAQLSRELDRFGLSGNQAVVDMNLINARIQKVIHTIEHHDHEDRFRAMGADVLFGSPHFIDKHTVEVVLNKNLASKQQPEFSQDRVILRARKFVIATGSRPLVFPMKGLDEIGCLTNEDVFRLEKVPSSLLVVGGGPIGMELAQSMQRLGSQVTVLLRGERILAREDEDMVDPLMKKLEQEGVCFIKNAEIESFTVNEKLKVCTYRTKDTMEIIEVEEVLMATGRRPNIEGLELENAGVEYTKRGIVTDSRLRTTNKKIFAIGDINGKFQFTHGANYEAGIALQNIVFHIPAKVDYTKIPWCTYVDPELASCGINEKTATEQKIQYKVWKARYDSQDRALAESENIGMCKILTKGNSGKILGVQILGPHAGEVIHEASLAYQQGLTIKALATSIHAYPTLSEIIKQAAGEYFKPKLFSKRTNFWLRVLFRFRGK